MLSIQPRSVRASGARSSCPSGDFVWRMGSVPSSKLGGRMAGFRYRAPTRGTNSRCHEEPFCRLLGRIDTISANEQQHVIVIDDIPGFDFDPLEKFRMSSIPARRTLADWLGNSHTVDLGFAPPGDLAGDSFIAPLAASLLQQTLAGAPQATLVDLKANSATRTATASTVTNPIVLHQQRSRVPGRRVLRSPRLPASCAYESNSPFR